MGDMTDAVPASGPRGVTQRQADPAASQVQPDSPQNLLARLFGAAQPDPAQIEAFKKAFPGVNPTSPDAAQKIMAELRKAGLQLPPNAGVGDAREAMISALQAANPGTDRAELEKKSLTELMGMYRGLQPGQQSAGPMQAQPGDGATPATGTPDAVERSGRRRGAGTHRAQHARRTGGRAVPRTPQHRRRDSVQTQPGARRSVQRREVQRGEPVSRQPAADPVITRANASLERIHGSADAVALREGKATRAQQDALVREYTQVLSTLPAARRDQGLDVVPESLRGRVRDTLNPPTP